MKYRCIINFRSIQINDIVEVEIGNQQVYITLNKHTTCANKNMLDTHFEKVEE